MVLGHVVGLDHSSHPHAGPGTHQECERIDIDIKDHNPELSRTARAAVNVAQRFGVTCSAPKILHNSNNTIVHLSPAPVVAKIATSVVSRVDASSAERELAVALYAVEHGANVVPPSDMLPRTVHKQDGFAMTFWDYVAEPFVSNEREPGWFGTEVRRLHDVLEGYEGPLADNLTSYTSAAVLLENRAGGISLLHEANVEMLRDRLSHYLSIVRQVSKENRVLHGDCRPGNVFRTNTGALWYDFEAACRGPRETDCFAMDSESLKAYGPVNSELLDVIRQLGSVCIAIWCNAQKGRSPQVDEAAEYHLELTRQRIEPL